MSACYKIPVDHKPTPEVGVCSRSSMMRSVMIITSRLHVLITASDVNYYGWAAVTIIDVGERREKWTFCFFLS